MVWCERVCEYCILYMWKGRDETKKSIHLCCSDTIGCSTVFNISHTIYWSCAIPIECWLVSLTGKVNIILVVLSCIALILIANITTMNGIQMSQHFISFISTCVDQKKGKRETPLNCCVLYLIQRTDIHYLTWMWRRYDRASYLKKRFEKILEVLCRSQTKIHPMEKNQNQA